MWETLGMLLFGLLVAVLGGFGIFAERWGHCTNCGREFGRDDVAHFLGVKTILCDRCWRRRARQC